MEVVVKTRPQRRIVAGRNADRRDSAVVRKGLPGFLLAAIVITGCAEMRAQESPQTASSSEVIQLREALHALQARVAELEAKVNAGMASHNPEAGNAATGAESVSASSEPDSKTEPLEFFKDTTINLGIDGYYGYNFNHPVGRVNLLRVYDVSSNSFSLNQANLVVERAPNLEAGRRYGARLDLQYGQATESSQGSAANEFRPQAYRPLWQAYGTYVFPVGRGLTVDFGKWASPMGVEGNYSKDQINYSRSLLFGLMPFYHMGARATYSFSDAVSLGYAVVNGVNQSEDFNGFKSQMVFLSLHPSKNLTWNINYHAGQEQRDTIAIANPGLPTGATQPGLPTAPIVPRPDGWLHIVDTNATWTLTAKLTLAGQADYVVNRPFSHSTAAHVVGGAAYGRYQLAPKVALAARAEYLSDRGGFLSGTTQALKETTLTYEYKFADGFIAKTEWRRDFSNQPFFLTEVPGTLRKEQNTATVGLIWWWGRKTGSW